MEVVVKNKLLVTLLATIIAAPSLSFAQSATPVTRDQVRAELAELRSVGYEGDTEASYPSQIQAAEQRLAEKHRREAQQDSGYGDQPMTSSASGSSQK
jgi:hypothetical protein